MQAKHVEPVLRFFIRRLTNGYPLLTKKIRVKKQNEDEIKLTETLRIDTQEA